jgi:hypothetical protein
VAGVVAVMAAFLLGVDSGVTWCALSYRQFLADVGDRLVSLGTAVREWDQ